jgi:hypothetical protein
MSKNYGKCKDCGVDLPTKGDAREHMSATSAPAFDADWPSLTARSHTISVLTLPREDLVRRRIQGGIFAIAEEFAETMARQVEEGDYTKSEVKDALAEYPEFEEAWECIESDVHEVTS